MKNRRCSAAGVCLAALGWVLVIGSPAQAQGDPTQLRINEVLSSNKSTPPSDAENQYEDMLEIINPSDQDIRLQNLIITDTVSKDSQGKLHPAGSPYKFLFGSVLSKRTFLTFCDKDTFSGGNGEPHASFKLSQEGGVVALFGLGDVLIDMVVIPRLATGTSYGRFPDGTGQFCHIAEPTFRKCTILTGGCADPTPNSPCANIPPEIDLHAHTSIADSGGANPGAGVPVPLIAQVWDEKENPGSIHEVTIRYHVDGGPEQVAQMTMDSDATSKIMKVDFDADPTGATLSQDENQSIWKGEIPGASAGSLVTFIVNVEDNEGASGTDPKVICSGSTTPDCKTPYRYRVAYGYQGPLVLNEVAPWNTSYYDTTDSTPKTDDYIEIYSPEDVSLEGYWLSTNAFRPDEWKFPPGTSMKAGDHLIVWCDGDAGKVGIGPYHTSFKLSKGGGVIFIFDKEANGLGMVDGLLYGPAKEDTTFSRCPDGSRTSPFVEQKKGTPTKPSNCAGPQGEFIRADSDDSGGLDISDAFFTLAYMFLDGTAPRCMDALDSDDNGLIEISDPLYTLNYLFLAGPPPPVPYPLKGPDTSASTLPPCP